tara:strand:+ start:774 stop:1007 length:234 start_codon:yes stop_codon:yes gene_type:complete
MDFFIGLPLMHRSLLVRCQIIIADNTAFFDAYVSSERATREYEIDKRLKNCSYRLNSEHCLKRGEEWFCGYWVAFCC